MSGLHEVEEHRYINDINNQMAEKLAGNVFCLYDFSRNFTGRCGYSESFTESELSLIDCTWHMSYYVDEFDLPTEDKYIYTSTTGTFDNFAASNSDLEAGMLVDKNNISIVLLEYGDSKVKNSSAKYADEYKILMLDSSNNKTTLSGFMYAGGDRIVIDSSNKDKVLDALKLNGTLRFYIEKKDQPTTNYTFAFPDKHGFPLAYSLLKGEALPRSYYAVSRLEITTDSDSSDDSENEGESLVINNPSDVGTLLRVKPALKWDVMQTLKNGTRVTIIGDEVIADGYTWVNVQTETGLTGWVNKAHVK